MMKSRAHLLYMLSIILLLLLTACDRDVATSWQGYAEGEYIYVAAPRGGRLLELAVRKGAEVNATAKR